MTEFKDLTMKLIQQGPGYGLDDPDVEYTDRWERIIEILAPKSARERDSVAKLFGRAGLTVAELDTFVGLLIRLALPADHRAVFVSMPAPAEVLRAKAEVLRQAIDAITLSAVADPLALLISSAESHERAAAAAEAEAGAR